MSRRSEWLAKYLAPLAGATILSVEVGDDDGDQWPVLKVSPKDSNEVLTIEVSQDEEGNGPGFLFGLPPVRL